MVQWSTDVKSGSEIWKSQLRRSAGKI